MTYKFNLEGKFKITKINKVTGEVIKYDIKNTIMDAILTEMAETLRGTASDYEILYFALGTGSTAVTTTDTTLDTEIFRTAVATESTPTTGQVEHTFIVLDSEAVATIAEIGIFGGSTATASADTGKLISRVLWSEVKSNSEELNVTYTNTLSRG